ncbi:MAG TPA: polymer-forming cytoskeletal protein [Bryobacteraceae bacterium]|jgi:cytoskeletal protein CcmA (bactofilin family)
MWGKNNESNTKTVSSFSTATPPPANLERAPASSMPAPPPAPRAGSANVGKTTRLHGDVYSEEELYIDGEIDGTVEVRNRLTIGPNGKIKASVKAKELIVRGSIQGDVEAIDRISIMTGASIVGDVKTAGIVIEDGAYFKGGIDILRPEVKKPDIAGMIAKVQSASAAGA